MRIICAENIQQLIFRYSRFDFFFLYQQQNKMDHSNLKISTEETRAENHHDKLKRLKLMVDEIFKNNHTIQPQTQSHYGFERTINKLKTENDRLREANKSLEQKVDKKSTEIGTISTQNNKLKEELAQFIVDDGKHCCNCNGRSMFKYTFKYCKPQCKYNYL